MIGAKLARLQSRLQKNHGLLIPKDKTNIFGNPGKGKRPFSVSVEDVFFGDSGKGSIVAKLNEILMVGDSLVSIRFNGGANAGHETLINGKKIVTHQLPLALVKENTIAIMSRGMVIHTQDLVNEIEYLCAQFGGELPGQLIIDDQALLGLDTMRAKEFALNQKYTGGRGATGSGISPTYASFYERHPVQVCDLISSDWEIMFRQHYQDIRDEIRNIDIKDIIVPSLNKQGKREFHKVGTENEFIDRLKESRDKLIKYVSFEVPEFLEEVWRNPKIPVTIEGAQGAGLDPWFGVYPDVTASRTMSRSIADSTYAIILPEEIALRIAVMKATYMSSVGQRVIPTTLDTDFQQKIREDNDEYGRTTGKPRGVYEIPIPMAQFFKRAAGFDFIAPTHLDSSKKNTPIKIVTHYTLDSENGGEVGYKPNQNWLNRLVPHVLQFPGWDGEAISKAKTPDDLPYETQVFLAFLQKTIAPIALAAYGPDIDQYIPFVNGLKRR